MLIQIRGTSGSGKTTLARAVMAAYPAQGNFYRPGRKQPLYTLHTGKGGRDLAVIGHYNCACGGADTIADGFVYILDLVRELHNKGFDVLWESMLMTGDTKNVIPLCQEIPEHMIVALTTPVQQCLDNVQTRRAAKGNHKPLNPSNTTSKHRSEFLSHVKLREAGVNLLVADYPTALEHIKRALEID